MQASSEKLCTGARRGEQDKGAKRRSRPSDKYRTSVLYFLMLVGRTPYLTYKIDSRPTFVG